MAIVTASGAYAGIAAGGALNPRWALLASVTAGSLGFLGSRKHVQPPSGSIERSLGWIRLRGHAQDSLH